VVVEAPDENKARAAAAGALKVPANELVLKIVKREKKGPFGLGGALLTIQATWLPPSARAPAAALVEEAGKVEFSCLKGKLSVAIHRAQGRGRPPFDQLLDCSQVGWTAALLCAQDRDRELSFEAG